MAIQPPPGPRPPEGVQVTRVFEQPPDAVAFYTDFVQIIGTGQEVVIQLYETIPGNPGPDGQVQLARSRLRATVFLSPQHAATIGRLLTERAQPGGGHP